MEQALALLPDNVKKELSVVSSAELGTDKLLHISTDPKIKQFVPNITKRTANNENRSVPRISTAPSLLGCLIGYCAAALDFSQGDHHPDWLGGWYIYGIPFELALKPSPKLLHDQRNSDEHWLITYSETTRSYAPTKLGKFFYRSVISQARTGKRPFKEVVMLVEVATDHPVLFAGKVQLTKGYWEITGPEPSFNVEFWNQDKLYTVKSISKGDYRTTKSLSADLLSYTPPPSAKW